MNRDSPEILLSGRHYRAVQRAAFAPEVFRDSKFGAFLWSTMADAQRSIYESSGKIEMASKSFSAFGHVISELKAINGFNTDWDDIQPMKLASDQPGNAPDQNPNRDDDAGDDIELVE